MRLDFKKRYLIWAVGFPTSVLRPFKGGKNNLFNKCCWGNWTSTCKRIKWDPDFVPYTKINLK